MFDGCIDGTTPFVKARTLHQSNNDAAAFTPSLPLYDPCSTLLISRQVADGYLILLTGGITTASSLGKKRTTRKHPEAICPEAKSSSADAGTSGESSSQDVDAAVTPESAITLAFISITDGNVIDSTFGVQTIGGIKRSKDTSTSAYNAARAAKEAIRAAAESSVTVQQLTVNTYKRCFEIVMDYHDRLDALGFITWCYKHQAVQKDALDDLEEVFLPLYEAVEAAS